MTTSTIELEYVAKGDEERKGIILDAVFSIVHLANEVSRLWCTRKYKDDSTKLARNPCNSARSKDTELHHDFFGEKASEQNITNS